MLRVKLGFIVILTLLMGMLPGVVGATALADQVSARIIDFAFQPGQITLVQGSTVTWTNQGQAAHTVTSDNGLWDSGNLATGKSFAHIFDKPGTYNYHCSIHPSMHGTIVVTAPQGAPAGMAATPPPAPAPAVPPAGGTYGPPASSPGSTSPAEIYGGTAKNSHYYVVRRGDTLSGISRRLGIPVSALISANGLRNANIIYAGTVLLIPQPAASIYIVRYGDTLSGIAARFGVSSMALAAANGVYNPNRIYAGMLLHIPGPGFGGYNSGYGMLGHTNSPGMYSGSGGQGYGGGRY